MSDGDEYVTDYKPTLSPAQRGVWRRISGVSLLLFSMGYGGYAMLFEVEINEVFIASIIASGTGLLGIGKLTKDVGE